MSKDIVISVPKNDTFLLEALTADASLETRRLSGAGMDGGGEYLILLIPLTHIAVKALVDLVKAHWERARHVKVEIDGLSVSGVSLNQLEGLLTGLLEKRDTEGR